MTVRPWLILSLALPALTIIAMSGASAERLAYWDSPRAGANFFNAVETEERFASAAGDGIKLVRLAPDKWKSARRDFLLGDADAFTGLVDEDLKRLKAVLDVAHKHEVKVVLTMLSLPGARWRQHHGDRSDFRLYREAKYQAQAVAFWSQLARALKGHPAIVGYNVLNEPHPERARDTAGFDLSGFYERVVAGIRTVDPDVPVILDAGNFASPMAFKRLRPLADPQVLYAFHNYEPWAYINRRNQGKWRYPGEIPDDGSGALKRWDRGTMAAEVTAPVTDWQRRHGVPASRIFAAEFGVPRTHPGASQWLADNISLYQQHGWHWAFYSYREDTWAAMDYELGTQPLPGTYWQDLEAGRQPVLNRADNPLWRVIQRGLKAR